MCVSGDVGPSVPGSLIVRRWPRVGGDEKEKMANGMSIQVFVVGVRGDENGESLRMLRGEAVLWVFFRKRGEGVCRHGGRQNLLIS